MCKNHARPDLGEWYTSAWFSFPYLENTNDLKYTALILQRSIACNIWDPAIGVINRNHAIYTQGSLIRLIIKDVKQAQRVNYCQSKFALTQR